MTNEDESNEVAMKYCVTIDTISKMFPSLTRLAGLPAKNHILQYRRRLDPLSTRSSGGTKCGACQSFAGESKLKGVVKLSCWKIAGEGKPCTRCCQRGANTRCSYSTRVDTPFHSVTPQKNVAKIRAIVDQVTGLLLSQHLNERHREKAIRRLETIKTLLGDLSSDKQPVDDAMQLTDSEGEGEDGENEDDDKDDDDGDNDDGDDDDDHDDEDDDDDE
jgi:hypothetical protein